MLKAKSNTTTESNAVTIIAQGTKINGIIESESINIYGHFEGTLKSQNTVTIAEKGYAKGEIYAQTLVVSGTVDGKASCDIIEVLEKGVLNGSIVVEELIIEKGGFFQGDSSRKSSSAMNTKKATSSHTTSTATDSTANTTAKAKS